MVYRFLSARHFIDSLRSSCARNEEMILLYFVKSANYNNVMQVICRI
jgi:hypothetical protein